MYPLPFSIIKKGLILITSTTLLYEKVCVRVCVCVCGWGGGGAGHVLSSPDCIRHGFHILVKLGLVVLSLFHCTIST